jgi:hypothetical protein
MKKIKVNLGELMYIFEDAELETSHLHYQERQVGDSRLVFI